MALCIPVTCEIQGEEWEVSLSWLKDRGLAFSWGEMRGNDLRFHLGRLRLDIWKKKNVMEKVVKPWKRLPKEEVEFPSHEEFQIHREVGFRDVG